MTLHLGLHWSAFAGMARVAGRTLKPAPLGTKVRTIVGMLIVAYGLYVFVHRELLSYMLARRMYVFLDYDESIILFYLDYVAMASLFGFVAHRIPGLLRKAAESGAKSRGDGTVARTARTGYHIGNALLSVFAVTVAVSSLRVCTESTPISARDLGGVASAPESSLTEDRGYQNVEPGNGRDRSPL